MTSGGAEPDVGTSGPQSGVALCLSGGGYRAMLFHAGSLWRLNEAGWLARLDRVSSVSGGSIAAGVLGLAWDRLDFRAGIATALGRLVVEPLRRLAGITIDQSAVLRGLLPGAGIAERVARSYREELFGEATLQALPDAPRFVLNATNLQSGVLWRFSKPYMGDYRVGRVEHPTVALADAVAASSAFPPVLSPFTLDLTGARWMNDVGTDLGTSDMRREAVLSDGGVYDNLGLETAWKGCRTVLVSDGGGQMAPAPKVARDWVRGMARVLGVIDNQVRDLRKRQCVGGFVDGSRQGAYWGIRTDIADYGLPDPLPCPHDRTLALARTATRLAKLDPGTQDRLINWGYAVTDAALRRHVDPQLPRPAGFPHPHAEV